MDRHPTNSGNTAYDRLEARFREVGLLRAVIGTLQWDGYALLPAGATVARSEQLGLLEQMVSKRLTAPDTADLLGAAEAQIKATVFVRTDLQARDLDQAQLQAQRLANLREMRRDHLHARAVPAALQAAWLNATLFCERQWREARARRDARLVAPALGCVVALTREVAQAKASALGLSPYEALLDRWEPGLRLPALQATLQGWRSHLPALAAEVAQMPARWPLPSVPVALQRALVPTLLQQVGFDTAHGVIAESAQPCFSDDTPDDVRITLRYDAERPLDALRGGLHETGHSFYERGVPALWRYQPAGRPRSGGLQESQALLWEVHVGGSAGFRNWLAPRLREGFGWQLGPQALAAGWAGNDLSRDRLDSGEVGYLLHLVVRSELEQELIGNPIGRHLGTTLAVDDLPEAWAAACKKWLGCEPSAHAYGSLADIHWYRGLFGYFPSYLLGAAAAAQLMEAARVALPALDVDLAAGQFTPLRQWLAQHVYSAGALQDAEHIIVAATGNRLAGDALMRHLRQRHLSEVD